MEKLSICTYGAPILRKKAAPIKKIDDRIVKLAEGMLAAMKAARGVGLAANQVGMLDQICVIDTTRNEKPGKEYILINPVVVEKEGKIKYDEGCLSFPEIWGEVERPAKIKVRALDLKEKQIEICAEGVLARALQHEIDHLSGILFIDYMSFAKKLMLKRELDKLKKENGK